MGDKQKKRRDISNDDINYMTLGISLGPSFGLLLGLLIDNLALGFSFGILMGVGIGGIIQYLNESKTQE